MDHNERMIKRQVLGVGHRAILRYPKGFSDVVLEEVTTLLNSVEQKFDPEIEVQATQITIRNIGFANLLFLAREATTLRDILWQIDCGKADTMKRLKTRFQDIPWPIYLPNPCKLALRVTSTRSRIFHEGEITRLLEKAIVAKCPGVNLVSLRGSEQLIDVRLFEDHLEICLSLGKGALYQRGYKEVLKGTASVKEDLAQCALRATLSFVRNFKGRDWIPREVLVPFAGSGTLGFEGLFTFSGIPKSLLNRNLPGDRLPCSPIKTVGHQKKMSINSALNSLPITTKFIEIDKAQALALEHNSNSIVAKLGLKDLELNVYHQDFFAMPPSANKNVFFPLNPPFGERLGGDLNIKSLYQEIGRFMNTWQGSGFIFVPMLELIPAFSKEIPKFEIEMRPINHGGKPMTLLMFTMP